MHKPESIVAYYRVSTQKQGHSGLGIEAQRQAVEEYAARHNARVIASFTEIESGKVEDRPELDKAIKRARAYRATLVIAKLDRLARNAAFTLRLRDSLAATGTKFVAADNPEANNLTIGVLAVVAQAEREAIAERTRAALAAAKRRGVRLGNPNGARALLKARKGNAASVEAIKAGAEQRARDYADVIDELRERGITSADAIAKALNEHAVPTPRDCARIARGDTPTGAPWHKSSVRNLLARIGQ